MQDQRISISHFLGVLLLLLLVVFPMCFMSIVNAFDDDVKITEVSHPLPAANLKKENSRNKRSIYSQRILRRTLFERSGQLWNEASVEQSPTTAVEICRRRFAEKRGREMLGRIWLVHIRLVNCAYNLGNNGRWRYTYNRQIKCEDGYCLSSAAGSKNQGYVYYDYCIETNPNSVGRTFHQLT